MISWDSAVWLFQVSVDKHNLLINTCIMQSYVIAKLTFMTFLSHLKIWKIYFRTKINSSIAQLTGCKSLTYSAYGEARILSTTSQTRSSILFSKSSKVMNGHSASQCVYLVKKKNKKTKSNTQKKKKYIKWLYFFNKEESYYAKWKYCIKSRIYDWIRFIVI